MLECSSFCSEGSLLDLDFLPWKRMTLRSPSKEAQRDLTKEHSVSIENLNELGKLDKSHLGVCVISKGCRAYSDSQLAPAPQGSTENVEKDDLPPPFPSSSSNLLLFISQNRNHHQLKLSSAKLHLKTLFGKVRYRLRVHPTDRRSRLQFMLQWSQMSHSRKRNISQEELVKWAKSLNGLLDSQTGVSVFGAFLRSEFSEENLQFYLACEQYRHSSNNFSLQKRAKDICATYIQPGSPREVNLDSKTRDLTIQLLQAPSHTSLSYAQKRIYSLLDTDCYPRFLQSNIYLSLLQQTDS
uniref:RGS domain-containing protein n=1 Tax=Mola mola TaxID=94237 RepID=A0A3Q3WL16_MOLML